MGKRKFRIKKVKRKQTREISILYGKKSTYSYEYYICFYNYIYEWLMSSPTYLCIADNGDGFDYSFWSVRPFATRFDTVEEAKKMIKLINEHPESFRRSPTNKDY